MKSATSRTVRGWLLVFVSLTGADLLSQTDRGTITGLVVDPQSATISAARVTATNQETGLKLSARTSGAGVYIIPQIPAGVYTVEAESTGFKKAVMADIRVGVLQTLTINFTLELGSITESVTVTAAPPLLAPSSSGIATNVAPRDYQDLPIFFGNGIRSPLGLVSLLPGTTPGPGASSTIVHIGGGQSWSREFQLDGVSVTFMEQQGNPTWFQVPVDSVQEFTVITNNFSAEFGRTGGGIESYALKAGTNRYHGLLSEYLRNDALEARGFYTLKVPVAKQHDITANMGGPLNIPRVYTGRDRTFFFFNFSAYRLTTQGANYLATVPSLKYREGILSEMLGPTGALVPIYDPLTTTTDISGNLTRSPFTGNIIPKNRMSKIALALQEYLPKPTRSGWFDNYDTSDRSVNRQDNVTGRIDHTISDRQKLSGSFVVHRWPQSGTAVYPYPISGKRPGDNNSYIARFSHDFVIGPTRVNHLALGFNRGISQNIGESNGVDWYSKLGLEGDIVGRENGFPSFTISGIGSLGGGGEFSVFNNTYNVVDSFSWQKASHSIKIGGEIRKMQNNSRNPGNGPSFTFGQGATAFPTALGTQTTGAGYASFLLGEATGTGMYVCDLTTGPRWTYYMIYAQDDWKVTRKLTLNIGLRYEMPTPWYDVNDRWSTVDLTKPNPGADGLLGALIFGTQYRKETGRRTILDTSWRELGPRLGLAYALSRDIVVRTAYGIFYNAGFGVGNGFRGLDIGYTLLRNDNSATGWDPVHNLDVPYRHFYAIPPFLDPSFANEGTAELVTPDADGSAYMQTWNVGIQKQIRNDILFDLSYVGSKGTRLPTLKNEVKQLHPKYWALGDLLYQNIYSKAVVEAGFKPPYSTFSSSRPLFEALAPLPQYRRLRNVRSSINDGNSTFHSFQIKAQKRFSQGVSFLISYTGSKTITDTATQMLRSGNNSFGPRDMYNKKLDKALSPDDRTHVVSIAYLYEIPLGPGKPLLRRKGVIGHIVGGWQINGILQYMSGTPIMMTGPTKIPLAVGEGRMSTPNVVTGASQTLYKGGNWDPQTMVYLNREAWTAPVGYTLGTSPLLIPTVRGFANMNENIGLFKTISIGESVKVQLKAEAQNAFNRFIPANPDGAWNPTSVRFGKTFSQINPARILQLGAKLTF